MRPLVHLTAEWRIPQLAVPGILGRPTRVIHRRIPPGRCLGLVRPVPGILGRAGRVRVHTPSTRSRILRALLPQRPIQGLAPLVTRDVFDSIQSIVAELGTAVLVVEQNANLALGIADRGYVLETGTIVLSGTAAELSSDDSIRRAYLGV